MIWDIENISLKHFKYFEKFIEFTPEQVYIIAKRELGIKEKKFFDNKQFSYYKSESIADEMIIKVLKVKKLNNLNFIIISSDSDFSLIIKELIDDDKNVHLIANHKTSKRLLMTLPLNNKYLKISSYDAKIRLKSIPKRTVAKNSTAARDIKCTICRKTLNNSKKEIRDVFYDKDLSLWIQKAICNDCMSLYLDFLNEEDSKKYLFYNFKRKYKKDINTLGFYNQETIDTEAKSNNENEYIENLDNGIDLKHLLKG